MVCVGSPKSQDASLELIFGVAAEQALLTKRDSALVVVTLVRDSSMV